MNIGLRLAIDKAKAANMPKDNIERAIKRGTGEDKEGAALERIVYEGYGPHGVALIIECVTDNRNRTVAALRHALTHAGGSLGETGSVAWQFTPRAYFTLATGDRSEDDAYELAIEAGAEDVIYDPETIEIFGEAGAFKQISDQLRLLGVKTDVAELRQFPNQEMALDPQQTVSVMRLIETLEDLDDVQQVDSNLAITDEALSILEAA
jgi:YebC/PmpR family DNA-binding regulatory protein